MNRKERRAAQRSQKRPPGVAPSPASASAPAAAAFASAVRHFQAGRLAEAGTLCQRALAADSDHMDSLHLLGLIAHQTGRHDVAVDLIAKAIALNDASPECHYNIALALQRLGRLTEAVAHFTRAVTLKPDNAEAHNNLAGVLHSLGRVIEADAAYRTALRLNPNYPEAYVGLGNVLRDLGMHADALASYRTALRLNPDLDLAHTNLIFAMNFAVGISARDQQHERRRWYERYGKRYAASIPRHRNRPDPGRRLRIGYVSAHFRHQAATYAFAPVILEHDSDKFEVFCYSDTVRTDDLTERIRGSVPGWRSVVGLDDDRLGKLIETDGIDILVDAVGFMAGNRLLAFARKPAPIQVTGWGEPTGTGMPTMDYLFADRTLVPVEARSLLAERVVELPCFLCYWTPEPLPDPGPPPALTNGHVTFGSFNRLSKINDEVLRCWAAILRSVPAARLVLKDHLLRDVALQARINRVLAREGIDVRRIAMLGSSDRAGHFRAYQAIDIALDPFPHGGGMTSLDALWMGVPVITWPGETISSRLAAASLTALGLADFVAPDQTAYVSLAAATATDASALAALRTSLRGRLANSPVGNAAAYARAVEAAYRSMWERWCRTRQDGAAAGGPPS
ncbi:MAG TPA: tetratricopeptide repeat protein [Xanthobacteraceae bacterium]|nr:tetratricopeptide repeat protein [Xanthobacteraceae bacterium]